MLPLFVYTYTADVLGGFLDVVLRKVCVIRPLTSFCLCVLNVFVLVVSSMQTVKRALFSCSGKFTSCHIIDRGRKET